MLTTINAGPLIEGAPQTEGAKTMKCKALKNFILKGHGVVMEGEIVDIPKHELGYLLGSNRIAEIEPEAESGPEVEPVSVDLASMTKAELLALAKARGVEVNPAAKKDDIITSLEV